MQVPVSVMIDNCVTSLSDTMQGVVKTIAIEVGGVSQSIRVLGFQRRPTPGPDDEWMRAQFSCLPTVARLARDEAISCYTYSELRHEAWRRPGSFPANVIGRLFADVSFVDVDAAVERSWFFKMDLKRYLRPDQVIQFCLWLINTDFSGRIPALTAMGKYPDFLLANLKNVGRFRELCAGLSQRQYPDAFHLWTAEANGVQYFLTMDRRFIRAMTQSKRIGLPCLPICPERLLEVLHVSERDRFPHPQSATIDIFGNRL